MKSFRSLFGLAALVLIAAIGMTSLGGCGTGTGAGADPAASSPASSHYKADLAAGYSAVEAVRVGITSALQTHVITVAQAEAVSTQCKAFTVTLDTLRAGAASTANQTTLTATLLAISAATAFVTISQGVPKS